LILLEIENLTVKDGFGTTFRVGGARRKSNKQEKNGATSMQGPISFGGLIG